MRFWMGATIGLTLLLDASAQLSVPLRPFRRRPPRSPYQVFRPHSRVRWWGTVLSPGTGTALSVVGGGDSLRSILRQVARATGMKVTGGVPDEPVYGSYGPAPVQQVMSTLFSGLSVNMMLVNDTATKPKELVLTARTGGATPPPPAQPLNASDDPADVNLAQPRPGTAHIARQLRATSRAESAGIEWRQSGCSPVRWHRGCNDRCEWAAAVPQRSKNTGADL